MLTSVLDNPTPFLIETNSLYELIAIYKLAS